MTGPLRAGLVIAAWLLPLRAAGAQVWNVAGADGAVARVHLRGAGSGASESLSGFVAEGRGNLRFGRLTVQAAYAQGHLAADSGAAASRDLVSGSILVGARPTSWLALAAGPCLRAYSVSGTVERWVLWEAHARFTGPVIVGTLRAHAEGWLALASSVNAAAGAGGAGGGEAGLTVLVPHTALWARFAYVVDQARMKGGVRTETLESVVLAVGLGAR